MRSLPSKFDYILGANKKKNPKILTMTLEELESFLEGSIEKYTNQALLAQVNKNYGEEREEKCVRKIKEM